jgi:hypothetical protein
LAEWVSDEAVSSMKFSDCLPSPLAVREVEARLRDDATVQLVIDEPVSTFFEQPS